MKYIYAVNFKETTIDSDNVMSVESGICDLVYENEKNAIKKCWELSDEILNAHLDELDEDLSKIESGERNEDDSEIYRETNDNGDYQTVHLYENTYEYWVSKNEIA